MGLPPPSSAPSHLYSQAIQLKLYQAFIFSVPILFSIILILLFYLFYLKRRRDSNLSSSSSPPSILSRRSTQSTPLHPLSFEVSLKEELKEKLPVIMFDEALKARDSQCCVCLGDFEMKEQLHQIPTCKHVFHIECIHNWLQANTTCPLCRRSIVSTTKLHQSDSEVQNLPFNSSQPNSDQQHTQHPELSQHHLIEVVMSEV